MTWYLLYLHGCYFCNKGDKYVVFYERKVKNVFLTLVSLHCTTFAQHFQFLIEAHFVALSGCIFGWKETGSTLLWLGKVLNFFQLKSWHFWYFDKWRIKLPILVVGFRHVINALQTLTWEQFVHSKWEFWVVFRSVYHLVRNSLLKLTRPSLLASHPKDFKLFSEERGTQNFAAWVVSSTGMQPAKGTSLQSSSQNLRALTTTWTVIVITYCNYP